MRNALLGTFNLDLVGLEVLTGPGITILAAREVDLDIVGFLKTDDILPALANQGWMVLAENLQSLSRLIGLEDIEVSNSRLNSIRTRT